MKVFGDGHIRYLVPWALDVGERPGRMFVNFLKKTEEFKKFMKKKVDFQIIFNCMIVN